MGFKWDLVEHTHQINAIVLDVRLHTGKSRMLYNPAATQHNKTSLKMASRRIPGRLNVLSAVASEIEWISARYPPRRTHSALASSHDILDRLA